LTNSFNEYNVQQDTIRNQPPQAPLGTAPESGAFLRPAQPGGIRPARRPSPALDSAAAAARRGAANTLQQRGQP